MKIPHIFFILVFILATGPATAAGRQCVDLFVVDIKLDPAGELRPYTELRSQLQPWELKRTGVFYRAKDLSGLESVLDLLHKRDGTYPLLIDNQGNLIIAHRLPDNQPQPGAAYLGTHRGLYLKMKENLGHEPAIVFAGQIRVVAGKTVSLADQAGTFYDLETDMQGDSSMVSLKQQLIDSNQKRINFAIGQLEKMGIADAGTIVFNFRKRSGGNQNAPADGHVVAKDAAEFEIKCRANPRCWAQFLKIETYLKKVSDLGGLSYLTKNLTQWLELRGYGLLDLFQIMGMITSEGTLDVMAMEEMMVPGTVRGDMFQKAYEQLDFEFSEYLNL